MGKIKGKFIENSTITEQQLSSSVNLSLDKADSALQSIPVASSTLGGIKSGTDITVDASGNVSVNDDSHNHIISNIDGLQSSLDSKYTNGSVIMNTNPFGGKRLYINSIDNALYAADKKWYVTTTRHLVSYGGETYPKLNPNWVSEYTYTKSGSNYTITNNPKPGYIVVYDNNTLKSSSTYSYNSTTGVLTLNFTPSGTIYIYPGHEIPQYLDSPVNYTYTAGNNFDGSYESGNNVPYGYYMKIRITPSQSGYSGFPGYTYGNIYASYYHTGTPEKTEYRVYNYLYRPHGIGWKKMDFSTFNGSTSSSSYIAKVSDNGNHGRSIMEFIIYGHDTSSGAYTTSLTELDWQLDRPNLSDSGSTVTKYGTNKLYSNLYFGNQDSIKVNISPTGSITADSIAVTSTTKVNNLNADMLDDKHASDFQLHSTILDNTTASFTTTLASNIATNNSKISFDSTSSSKLAGIEAGAEVNNISDANATDLTDGGATTLHKHSYNNLDDKPSIPTQYTNEMAQDSIGTILTDSAEIDFTYNDSTPSITASLKTGSIDVLKLDSGVQTSLGKADSALQNLSGLSTSNLSEGTNLYYTEARVSANSSVVANTAKVGITTAQANAIVANTAKVGITTEQANAIVANTAKVGITTAQANAIVANTAKVSNATHSGDVTGSTTLTLANVNSNVGSFTAANITVNAKGLITAASNGSLSNLDFVKTINSNKNGIIYKGGSLFLHDFTYGANGTTTTLGYNVFLGINSGNLTMGSSATSIDEASYNVGIGAVTLNHNTIGQANSCIGYRSLYSNTTGNYNTGFGYESLFYNTMGDYNVAIGKTSLYKNIGGDNNIGIGQDTLYDNTNGSANIAIGNMALSNNTTADFNIGVGISTLYSNSTGHHNIGVGQNTLYTNSTGIYNVGIGNSVLYSNTDGTYNVGVGYNILYNNTGGDYNTGMGYNCLSANTTGGYNVGIGYETLLSNTTGSYNVAMGHQALRTNVSGNYSIAIGAETLRASTSSNMVGIGYRALKNATTATANTAIGSNALYNITTGSGNVAIGNEAAVFYGSYSGLTTGSNSIFIGN